MEPPSAPRVSRARPSIARKLGRWAAELILVFVGAYAAFWLNGFQERQRDAERRDAILASLEQDVRDAIDDANSAVEQIAPAAAAFRQKVEAGEMPTLGRFVFINDYSPTDVATILQSGGSQLLSAQTLAALRTVESTLRSGLARMTRYEKLSDQLIVPHVDEGPDFFYDPATKRLRKRFDWYPQSLEDAAEFFREVMKAEQELLTQIQTERRQHG